MKNALIAANPCTQTLRSLPVSIPAGSVICVTGSASLSGLSISNAVIIADGDVTSSMSTTLSQVTVVSKTGQIGFSGGNTLDTVKLFAETTVSLSGQTDLVSGKSTLAAGGGVDMSGGTSALTVSNGKPTIGVSIISPGAIRLSGGTDMYVSVWGGSTVTLSGNTTLRGGIAAMGQITLSGGAAVDSFVNVDNDDLEHTAALDPITLSGVHPYVWTT